MVANDQEMGVTALPDIEQNITGGRQRQCRLTGLSCPRPECDVIVRVHLHGVTGRTTVLWRLSQHVSAAARDIIADVTCER